MQDGLPSNSAQRGPAAAAVDPGRLLGAIQRIGPAAALAGSPPQPFVDQLPLELRKGGQGAKHQPSGARGRLNVVVRSNGCL